MDKIALFDILPLFEVIIALTGNILDSNRLFIVLNRGLDYVTDKGSYNWYEVDRRYI